MLEHIVFLWSCLFLKEAGTDCLESLSFVRVFVFASIKLIIQFVHLTPLKKHLCFAKCDMKNIFLKYSQNVQRPLYSLLLIMTINKLQYNYLKCSTIAYKAVQFHKKQENYNCTMQDNYIQFLFIYSGIQLLTIQ